MVQEVFEAHFDVERFLVHGFRRIEFIEVVRFKSVDEVLPSRDGKLGGFCTQLAQIACAGRHGERRELLLALLEGRDDVRSDEFLQPVFLCVGEKARTVPRHVGQRVKTLLLFGEALVVLLDDGRRFFKVGGDVLFEERRQAVEAVAVVLDVGDLPMTVARLLHGEEQREFRSRQFVLRLDVRRRRRAVAVDGVESDDGNVLQEAALEEVLKVDAQLASLQEAAGLLPFARLDAACERRAHPRRDLRLDELVETHGFRALVVRQGSVGGEETAREIVIDSAHAQTDIDVTLEFFGVVILRRFLNLGKRVFGASRVDEEVPEHGADGKREEDDDEHRERAIV